MSAWRARRVGYKPQTVAMLVVVQLALLASPTNTTTGARRARIVRLGGLHRQSRHRALLVMPDRPARRGRVVRRAQTILGLRRVLQSAINAKRDTVAILALLVLLHSSTPFRRELEWHALHTSVLSGRACTATGVYAKPVPGPSIQTALRPVNARRKRTLVRTATPIV